MIQPSLEVNVDDAGLCTSNSCPTSLGDGRRSRPSISTSGVHLPDGGYPDDLDLLIDSFEPTPVRSRINDRGELAYVDHTSRDAVGHGVLRACIYLTDENPDPRAICLVTFTSLHAQYLGHF